LKVKIDFGRVLPGLLLVVAGLVLIAVLLIVAVVAFLFSFISGLGGVAGLALELMLFPALLIAVGVVAVMTGVSWWGRAGDTWFSGWAARRAMKDRLRISERTGELFGVVLAVIVFLFLYENQLRGAAFFTSSFGSLAQFFFYGPLFTGIILSFARGIYGRRNAVRPFDCLNMLFLAIAAFWLLSTFPFDFTQFGAMFPPQIQFAFGWLNNEIGRFLFALTAVVSLINMVYTGFLYSAVRGQLEPRREPTPV
jgi:hypothetical protein